MPSPLDLEGAATVQTALDLLGAGGQRWTGGTGTEGRAFTPDVSRGGYDYCVVGALIAAAPDYPAYRTAYEAVKSAVGGNIARWNNRDTTTFADVSVTLRQARLSLLEA
jgi:hypothetical protein